jgi:murein DD-endopeptidase MepM/ murein hydrolase activator NlpD
MKKFFVLSAVVFIAFLTTYSDFSLLNERQQEVRSGHVQPSAAKAAELREIKGCVKKGETLFDIFRKYGLDLGDLFKLREASADIHKLKKLEVNRPFRILLDDNDQIDSFTYWIDDDTILKIKNTGGEFCAEKVPVQYEKKIEYIGGVIKGNLVSSLGEDRNGLMLALDLSDIFAWDIDFSTDIRNGDSFKVVVEGLYLNGEFRKYGKILSAEVVNNGETYRAYGFEDDGRADYYDASGKSLRKAFLRAPLSFRRISSTFSNGRLHPILRIYRPHHGIDYAAPTGTPVSASGDGMVLFAGRRGGYGNLVILRHPNGFKTYYGHLSRIGKTVRSGVRVEQGDLIGYVGATGLATGPHLHYEMSINNRPVNPLSVRIPRGRTIPTKEMADFVRTRRSMDAELAAIPAATFFAAEKRTSGGEGGRG